MQPSRTQPPGAWTREPAVAFNLWVTDLLEGLFEILAFIRDAAGINLAKLISRNLKL
jgi:hypothetical protein